MAFGEELGVGKDLKYYNFDFKNKVDAAYWVVSFYVFLNIAAFSVYIIVIRTNILKIINPAIDPQKLSSNNFLLFRIYINFFILNFSSNFIY